MAGDVVAKAFYPIDKEPAPTKVTIQVKLKGKWYSLLDQPVWKDNIDARTFNAMLDDKRLSKSVRLRKVL